MLTVTLGPHSKITAAPCEQAAIRRFFRDTLGAAQTRETERFAAFQPGPVSHLGVLYENGAPAPATMQQAIWLELATADPRAMETRIPAGGGREIDDWDKEHFYFQAPGGQVLRLISTRTDVSNDAR